MDVPISSLSSFVSTFLVVGIVLFGLAIVVARVYEARGTRWFVALLVLGSIWALLAGIKLIGPPALEYAIVAFELPYGVLFSLVFFVFASQYTGHQYHRTRRFRSLVAVALAVLAALLLTSPFHDLLWESITLTTAGFPHLVHVGLGPVYVAYVVFAYLIALAGGYFLLQLHFRSRYSTLSLILVVVGTGCPMLINAMSIFDLAPVPGLDYTPVGLAGFGIVTTIAIHRDLFDIVPVARDTAVENIGEGMLILDSDRRIRDYNPAAERMFPTIDSHVGEELSTVVDLGSDFSLQVGASDHTELSVTIDNQRRDLSVTAVPNNDVHHLGWTIVCTDITEQKERERHLELIARVLRHNLANSITVIEGHAKSLREADTVREESVEAIIEHANRIQTTSDKIRTIQKIITGDNARTVQDLAAVVRSIVDTHAEAYPGVEFQTSLPETARVYCHTGLETAIANLVENAIVHNDAADPRVELTVSVERYADSIRLSVTDNGPGVPPTEIEAITRRETPLRHGSGVGLQLVYWFVKKSGGSLEFGTNPAGGTDVRVTFDRAHE